MVNTRDIATEYRLTHWAQVLQERAQSGLSIKAYCEQQGNQVYLACGYTDMRKSINGLMVIVEGNLRLDPFGEALFDFCNRSRDRLKILQWDGDEFWLHFKRPEKGHFRWPQPGEESTMTLSTEELGILLGGAKVELKLRRNEVLERRII